MRKPLRILSLFAPAFTLFVGFTQACGGQTARSGETSDDGSACNTDQDCVGGSCVYAGSCPGTCLPYRTQGESCGSNVRRPDDGRCTIDGVPTPCAPDPVGECMPDSGLACDPIAYQCLPTPPVVIADAGQPCSIFGARCNMGLYRAPLPMSHAIVHPLGHICDASWVSTCVQDPASPRNVTDG